MFGSATGSIKAPVKELKKALAMMRLIVSRNPIISILENIFIQDIHGSVSILGSDLHNVLSVTVDYPSTTENHVVLLLEFNRLEKLIRSLSSDIVTFTPENNSVKIECEEGSFWIIQEPRENFPKTHSVSYSSPSATIRYDTLSEGLSLVKGTTSTDDLRPALTAIRMEYTEEQLHMISTDGHRLSYCSYKDAGYADLKDGILLQRKAADFIVKIKSSAERVHLRWNENNICITCGNVILISRLIDEKFPDWRKALPDHGNIFASFKVADFRNKIHLAKIFSNTTTSQIKLKFIGDGIDISSEDLDYTSRSEQRLEVYRAGFEEFSISFNGKSLLEILKPYKSTATLHCQAPNKGAVLRPDDQKLANNYFHLIMPVILNDYV
jgi:DNA polymerase III subunit beta